MELVVATNNRGKLAEIQAMLPGFRILTLQEIGFSEEIPEPFDTFQENAFIKADTVHRYCGKTVMADDSGLCIDALDGAPGVYSARYAGLPPDDERNINQVLAAMSGRDDRQAHYRAVICLVESTGVRYFEGTCPGTIAEERAGRGGFGYDPIFRPDGFTETFGQLPPDIKHRLSHRGQAVRAMAAYLRKGKH